MKERMDLTFDAHGRAVLNDDQLAQLEVDFVHSSAGAATNNICSNHGDCNGTTNIDCNNSTQCGGTNRKCDVWDSQLPL